MSTTLTERVSLFLRRQGLAGARLVVAVSGGPDSVCLLHVLSTLKDDLGLTLHVAHLDHHLRADSAEDASYVARLAEKMGFPLTMGQADVRGYCEAKKLSIEEAAREVRYNFLAEVAEKLGTPYIVTAHTGTDQAETILLHIIRGTGIRGLIGLKPLTPWTLAKHKIALVRPLLEVRHADTQEYCEQFGLEPHLDITNLSLTPLRNRIRLELLPRLKKYNPGIEAALIRLASAADVDIKYLDKKVAEIWNAVVREEAAVVTLDKSAFLALPPALQSHLLRRAIERLLGNIKDIEMRHIDYIMSSVCLGAGIRIDLPYGLVFVVGYDFCWLGNDAAIPSPYPGLAGEQPLTVPGTTTIPGWRIEASITDLCPPAADNALLAFLDFDKVGQQLVVRSWQAGDRFTPLGMDKEKKLARFMADSKIPRHWRRDIPVVVSPAEVVWLVGHRLDDRVKVTGETRRVLKLEFKRS